MRFPTLIFVFFVSLYFSQAIAQTPKAFVCRFDKSVSYENGEVISSSESLEITFASVDFSRSTAQIIGNQGANYVYAEEGVFSYNFIERTGSGNIILTSIYKNTEINLFDNRAGLFSVHSRHTAFPNHGTPSQLRGICSARI
jgi:hypothetical protein